MKDDSKDYSQKYELKGCFGPLFQMGKTVDTTDLGVHKC